jgi:hypothetical protein
MMTVQWPGTTPDATLAGPPVNDDFSVPVSNLMKAVNEIDKAALAGPDKDPDSLYVITADVTGIAKLAGIAIAALGGSAAVVTGLKGLLSTSSTDSVGNSVFRATTVFSGAVMAVGLFIAVALIVRADVAGRALTAAAKQEARADMIVAMLKNYRHAAAETAPTLKPGYNVLTEDGSWSEVKSFVWEGGNLKVLVDGDKLAVSELRGLVLAGA